MKAIRLWAVVGAAVLALVGLSVATQKTEATPQDKNAPLISHDFETEAGGWVAFGGTGKVEITRNKNDVHAGKGALAYSYVASKDRILATILPVTEFGKATGIQFWVKTDVPTAVLLNLNEKTDEQDIPYQAVFTTKNNEWQRVTIPIEDFILDENKTDPNGKLDLDKVNGIGFLDVLALFGANDPGVAMLLGDHSGTRFLWLDEFTVLTRPMTASKRANGVIDTFDRDYVSWLHTPNVTLSNSTGPALVAEYERKADALTFWAHAARPWHFADATRLQFTASATRETTLYVLLEEKGGGKYHALADLPDSGENQEFNVKLSEFVATDDSADTNNKLDLDQVKLIGFADATLLLDPDGDAGKLTVRIRGLKAAP